MALKVGTIGYKHLFPELPPSARFRRYAELFSTVELPQTYNRIPPKEVVLRWRQKAPSGFTYSFVAPKYLSYRPSGKERRTLRKFLRRHRLLGDRRGGVRFLVPEGTDLEGFREWLSLLAELEIPGDYAFEAKGPLAEAALQAGFSVVNGEGPFLYLIDPKEPALGEGYAYFHRLEDALRYSSLAQGGRNRYQTL